MFDQQRTSKPLADVLADRLNDLQALQDGWANGMGDRVTDACLVAAERLLGAWPMLEQEEWEIDATPDGEIRLARETPPSTPGSLFFVDVDRSGECAFVWFVDSKRTIRSHAIPEHCARDVLTVLGSLAVPGAA